MELEAVIKSMEANDGHVKSAAAQTPAVADNTNLKAALEKAAGTPARAQEVDAVQVLMKTASELAGTEKEAEVAHAALCGQAFADGAIAKLAAYDAQVQQVALQEAKVASYAAPPQMEAPMEPMSKIAAATVDVEDQDIAKFAAEAGYEHTMKLLEQEKQASGMSKFAESTMGMSDDEIVKLAAEAGYQDTLEKLAADYNAGHDDALQQVHDVAATEFLKGAAETEAMLNIIEQQQG
jgi:hypothetical protein